MKKSLFMMFFVFCLYLNAANLVNVDFATALPGGWTQTGSTGNHWFQVGTNNAGGNQGELVFDWLPRENGTFRYVSPAFNTTMVHNMSLSFKHKLDWYQESFNLSVQISTDLSNWNTIWSLNATADVGPQQVSAQLPWNWGNSASTYLALVYTGDTYFVNSWWIDDLSLSYENTLGSGTWTAASYYPVGSVIIPSGHTLTIPAGRTINMANSATLFVEGRLLAIGTEQQKITFTCAQPENTWRGIDFLSVAAANDSSIIHNCVISRSTDSAIEIENSPKIRISSSELKLNSAAGSGGGIRCVNSDVEIKNCFIQANHATADGSGVYISGGYPRFHHNRVIHNTQETLYQHGALALVNLNLTGVTDNRVMDNGFPGTSGAIYLANVTGILNRHTVTNNSGSGIMVMNSIIHAITIEHCTIVNNAVYGIWSQGWLNVHNSIVYGNASSDNIEIFNNSTPGRLQVSFCCIGTSNYGNDAAYYQNCFYANPLFRYPSAGAGSDYSGYDANWTLSDLSPCIDAGDFYSGEYDADFSAPDLGVYPRRLKPTIYSAADVYPDQGHQIDLRWYPNDKDKTWDPAAWYHIFRSADERAAENAVLISDPRQISQELIASGAKICWMHNQRILTYLGQVKAMNRNAYSLIVPTLQDSSSTGLHAENFVVTYFDNVYFWDSVGLTGYSVDNIPPLAPRSSSLSRAPGNALRLDWEEVTEGIWEGNSYPETNRITYLIYASDQPDFHPRPENFLMQTTDLVVLLDQSDAARRFFRIVASDSR